jgi:UDP-galactopyranose mutase
MIYTGPVDAYFDYCFGKLPYRSLEFKHETHETPVFQSAPVVNYPNDQLYTRVTEFKYLTGQEHAKTSIVYEFPKAEGDAYYPVPRKENAELYSKYRTLADKTAKVHFVGRLATYKYYNMDQIVAQALTTYGKIAGMRRVEAMVKTQSNGNATPKSNGSGTGQSNGKGHKPALNPIEVPERVMTAVNQ